MRSLSRLCTECGSICKTPLLIRLIFLFGFLLIMWINLPLTRNYSKNSCPDVLPPPEVMFVLVKGYMRGGSTFTADILQQHADAIYFHEPVFLLQWKDTKMNGQELDAMFRCDFDSVSPVILNSLVRDGRLSRKTQNYVQCRKKNDDSDVFYHLCQPLLTSVCNDSHLRLIKELRLNIKDIEYLLKKYTHFKLIHLVRDPRAIVFSRLNMKGKSSYVFKQNLVEEQDLCSFMESDITDSLLLKKLYPDQIKIIQFEELATNPIEQTRELYRFLNQEPTAEVLSYVRIITSHPIEEEDPYLTRRHNSSEVVNRWRNVALYERVKRIDDVCKHVYPKLGYIELENENMMTDLSIKLWRPSWN